MLNSFEKESKLNERRAARLVQMRLMEEAASGTLPLPTSASASASTSGGRSIRSSSSGSSIGDIRDGRIVDRDYNNFGSIMGTAAPFTSSSIVNDIEMNAATVGTFVVDDESNDFSDHADDADESPFSSSSIPNPPSASNASDHLWNKPSLSPEDSPNSSPMTTNARTSTINATTMLTRKEETGENHPPGKVWRNWKWTTPSAAVEGEKDSTQESRELILLASRRLSQDDGHILYRHQSEAPTTNDTPINTTNIHSDGINLHGFHSHYNEDDEYELYHRQRGRATRYIKLPMCCFTYNRHIIAVLMIMTLLILLLGVLEPFAHSNDSGNGGSPPWAGIKNNHNRDKEGKEGATNAISNPDKFSRVKDRLLERSISHASSLEDTSSPQYKALLWIVNEDVRHMDVPNVEEDDDQINEADKESLLEGGEDGGEQEKTKAQRTLSNGSKVEDDEATLLLLENEHALFQRYALATLYYQTTDIHIVRQSLTGHHVKDPFELPFNPLDLQKEDIKWRNNENWLSGLGYCAWHGITCHPRSNSGGGGEGSASAMPDNENDDYYVSSLNLTNNNLNGIIPHELYTAFPKLRVLDISKNEMGGTIGREIGLLVHLQG